MDLTASLARAGLSAEAPSLAYLRALPEAHVRTFTFDNRRVDRGGDGPADLGGCPAFSRSGTRGPEAFSARIAVASRARELAGAAGHGSLSQ